MNNFIRMATALIAVCWSMPLCVVAQPPFQSQGQPGFNGPPGGMRGGFQGGFQGGGFQGGFQPGGGDRGGSRGGPPSSSGGSSFRGGPPSGGDRGGSSSFRGGPPGSDRGGMPGGGDRGGFDPSAMLERLDANQNGSLDPDEMQGPARFMLDRLAQTNKDIASSLAAGKPVGLKKIKEEISKMRGDRSSSSSSSNNSNGGSVSSAPTEPEPLVPGFGVKKEATTILSFGVAGSQASNVKIEDRDLKEAQERLQRYDSNKDGILDEKEIREGRWSDNPMQFDRNGDKKLSVQELAVRYAKRRAAEEAERQSRNNNNNSNASVSRGDRRGGDERSREKEEPYNPWSKQASYKFAPSNDPNAKTPGLPEWFASSDGNRDGQIMMHEYASNWDEATLKEFSRFDTNGDGTITILETLGAVKKGVLRGVAASGTSSSSASTSSTFSTSTSATASPSAEMDRSGLPENPDKRWVDFSALQIKKADKDKNNRLTPDEWSASAGDFNSVDKDGDGSVTLAEMYDFRKNKK